MSRETTPQLGNAEAHTVNYELGVKAIGRLIEAYEGTAATFSHGKWKNITATSAQIGLDGQQLVGVSGSRKMHYTRAFATSFADTAVGSSMVNAMVTILPAEFSDPHEDDVHYINLAFFRHKDEDPWAAVGYFPKRKGTRDPEESKLVVPKLQIATFGELTKLVGEKPSSYRRADTRTSLTILQLLSSRRANQDIVVM